MSIQFSEQFLEDVCRAAHNSGRTVEEQLEHWAHIGRVLEENPDLTYEFVKGIEASLEDIEAGRVEPYQFG